MIFALFGTKFCRGIGVGKMGCSDAYCCSVNVFHQCLSYLLNFGFTIFGLSIRIESDKN